MSAAPPNSYVTEVSKPATDGRVLPSLMSLENDNGRLLKEVRELKAKARQRGLDINLAPLERISPKASPQTTGKAGSIAQLSQENDSLSEEIKQLQALLAAKAVVSETQAIVQPDVPEPGSKDARDSSPQRSLNSSGQAVDRKLMLTRDLAEELERTRSEKQALKTQYEILKAVTDKQMADMLQELAGSKQYTEQAVKLAQDKANQAIEDMRLDVVRLRAELAHRMAQQKAGYESQIESQQQALIAARKAQDKLQADLKEQGLQIDVILQVRDRIITRLKTEVQEKTVALAVFEAGSKARATVDAKH